MAQALAGAPPRVSASAGGFSRAAWSILAYNVLVVLWGAYVRATGSGDGCGNHWPLCQGNVLPRAPQAQTLIEFTHRASVFVAFLAVAGLVVWAFRAFPRGHRARLTSAWSLAFFFMEALLGAGLVLFRYVAHNASAGRAVYLSAHLVNTQILLAMLAMTAWFGADAVVSRPWRLPSKAVMAALAAALVVAVTGAIAALGDTLYPASSVGAGMRQEFAGTAAGLLRLRALHPLVAVAGAIMIVLAALSVRRFPSARIVRSSTVVTALVIIQLAAGALNLLLLAPVWMQLLHLLLADALWIALVILFLASGQALVLRSAAPKP